MDLPGLPEPFEFEPPDQVANYLSPANKDAVNELLRVGVDIKNLSTAQVVSWIESNRNVKSEQSSVIKLFDLAKQILLELGGSVDRVPPPMALKIGPFDYVHTLLELGMVAFPGWSGFTPPAFYRPMYHTLFVYGHAESPYREVFLFHELFESLTEHWVYWPFVIPNAAKVASKTATGRLDEETLADYVIANYPIWQNIELPAIVCKGNSVLQSASAADYIGNELREGVIQVLALQLLNIVIQDESRKAEYIAAWSEGYSREVEVVSILLDQFGLEFELLAQTLADHTSLAALRNSMADKIGPSAYGILVRLMREDAKSGPSSRLGREFLQKIGSMSSNPMRFSAGLLADLGNWALQKLQADYPFLLIGL